MSTNQPFLSAHLENKLKKTEVEIFLHASIHRISVLMIKTRSCGQEVAKHGSFTM